LRDAIQGALLLNSASNWEPIINDAGVPAAKVLNISEVMKTDQVIDRQFFGTFSREECGLDRDIQLPKAAFQFRTNGPALRTPPPRIGADTKTILENLGYSPDEVELFSKSGVV
jgi:crotonobetainyl-CoA:carnitine CoA-transferase CaiB-like acyl-CoA transferase